ncbi:ArsR/SmtB family transcription factor [Halopiger goleimassiliensis]|uniref:ArsR/SmtB family transcription factor n=1 Tax=Halopiger goleimassiliensis TaxID=1293048 RepID=UPI000677B0DE|nr:helix-turn-helix transcriptional regulator [Halopiger goleimassiliensis]
MTPDGDDPPNGPSETPGGDRSLEDIPLSLDALLDILANERRRYLLEYLWDQPGNVGSFEAATKYTITKVGQKRGSQPNHDDIQVDLQQHHLPKLADAGVVEYDVRSQTIRYHEHERLESLYESVRAYELD